MSVLLSGISLVYHQCCGSEGKAFVFAWLGSRRTRIGTQLSLMPDSLFFPLNHSIP